MFCYISLIILGFSNFMFEKQPPIVDPSYPSQKLFNRFKPNCTWKIIGVGERAALVCSRRLSNVVFWIWKKKDSWLQHLVEHWILLNSYRKKSQNVLNGLNSHACLLDGILQSLCVYYVIEMRFSITLLSMWIYSSKKLL
jgi:hypothetical protein